MHLTLCVLFFFTAFSVEILHPDRGGEPVNPGFDCNLAEEECKGSHWCVTRGPGTGCQKLTWGQLKARLVQGDDSVGVETGTFTLHDDPKQIKLEPERLKTLVQTPPDSLAFAGGGIRAEYKEWGSLWALFHNAGWGMSYDDFMNHVKSVGTNSGGGWFFSGTLFNPPLYRSFGDGEATDFNFFINSLWERMAQIQAATPGYTEDEIQNKGLSPVVRAYCPEPDSVDCWKRFIDTFLGHYENGVHWDVQEITWLSSVQLLSRWKWFGPESEECTFPQFLEGKGEVDKASMTARGVIPLFYQYDLRNQGARIIPIIPLMQQEKFNGREIDIHCGSYEGKATSEEITRLTASAVVDDQKNPIPKRMPGPSSDAPGANHASASIASWIAEKLMSKGHVYSSQWIWRTAPKIRLLDDEPNAPLPEKRVGLGLVDGGTLDNVGLAAAVRGLQNQDINFGRIFAFTDLSKGNIPVYFEDNPSHWPVEVAGSHAPTPHVHIFEKWIRCPTYGVPFAGTNTKSKTRFETFWVITRFNKGFGIAAGSVYEITFVINDMGDGATQALLTPSSTPDNFIAVSYHIARNIACTLGNQNICNWSPLREANREPFVAAVAETESFGTKLIIFAFFATSMTLLYIFLSKTKTSGLEETLVDNEL